MDCWPPADCFVTRVPSSVPAGWLALELDTTRAAKVAAQAGSLGWMDVVIHADLFGRERYLLARRSAQP